MAVDFLSDINKQYKEAMNYPTIDRLMVKIIWWHFGVFTLIAFTNSFLKLADRYPSPLSWRVISLTEAAVAVAIGLVAALLPALLRGRLQNHYAWRVLVTTVLTVYSYLLVFISGGSIEMHFHFFMIVSLLIIYADWRLGWILLVLTGLHHVILNYFEPGWVYFYGRNDFAVVSHAFPVLIAVIFTTLITQSVRKTLVDLSDARQGLEATVTEKTTQLKEANQSLEKKVTERTEQLEEKLAEVQELNKVMVGRELKLAEQKAELAALKSGEDAKKD